MECGWEFAGACFVKKTSENASLLEEGILDEIVDDLLQDLFVDEQREEDGNRDIDEYLESLIPQDDESAPSARGRVIVFGNEGEGNSPLPESTHSAHSQDLDLTSVGEPQDSDNMNVQPRMVEGTLPDPDNQEMERQRTPPGSDIITEALEEEPELLHETETGPSKSEGQACPLEEEVPLGASQFAKMEPTMIMREAAPCAASQAVETNSMQEESVLPGTPKLATMEPTMRDGGKSTSHGTEKESTRKETAPTSTPQTAKMERSVAEGVQSTSHENNTEPDLEEGGLSATSLVKLTEVPILESVPAGTSQDDSSTEEDREGQDTDCSIPKSITSNTCSGGSSENCEEKKVKSAPASVRGAPIDHQPDLFGISCRRDDCGGGMRSITGRHLLENAASPDCRSKYGNTVWRGKESGQLGQPKTLPSPNSKTRSLFVDAIRELAKQQKAEMVARANEEKERLERIARQARIEREDRLAKEKAARLEEERQKAVREEEARKAREVEKQKAIQEAERLRIAEENEKRRAAEDAEKMRRVAKETVWRRVVRDTTEPGKQKKTQDEEGDKKGVLMKTGMERQCSGESRKSTSTAVWENDAGSDGGSDPFRRDLEWGWSEEISEGEELIQTRRSPTTNEKQQQMKDTKRVATKGSSKVRPSGGKPSKQDSVKELPVRRTDSGRNSGRAQNVGGAGEGPPKAHMTKSAARKAKKAKSKRRQQSERESVGSNESAVKEPKTATRSSSRSPVLVVPKGKVVRPGVSSPPAAPPAPTPQTVSVEPSPPPAEPAKSSGLTAKRHPELVCTGTQTSAPAAPPPVETSQRSRPRYSITYKAAVQKAIVMESNCPPPPPESPPSPAPQDLEEPTTEMGPQLSSGSSLPGSPEFGAPQTMSTPSPSQVYPPQMMPAFPQWFHYPPMGFPVPGIDMHSMPALPHLIQPYWTTYCGLFHPTDICESKFPIPNEDDLWAGDMERQEQELAFAKKCQPVLREEYQEMVMQGRHLPWRR
ncbi:hypothetical protein BSKO_08176 [Bryopsis sp. KO-2023]|nr:hypothetical protein BSKO_08176 [Bryopsis sp. KO-2023]